MSISGKLGCVEFYGRIKTFRTCRRTTKDTGASKIGEFHFSINRNIVCYCSTEMPALEYKGGVHYLNHENGPLHAVPYIIVSLMRAVLASLK